jgi:hypothetical protein
MPRTFNAPKAEDLNNDSDRLEADGYFHVYVKDVRDGEPHYDNTAIEGFSCHFQVMGGEHDGKTAGTTLRDGQLTHKDEGEFCRKYQSAFCVATNLLTPAQLNGGEVSFDEQAATNHQLIIKVKGKKKKDDNSADPKKFYDIDGLGFFHVDDPRVADVPKSPDALAMIDPAFRRPAEYFAPLVSDKKGGAAQTKKQDPPPTFDAGGL